MLRLIKKRHLANLPPPLLAGQVHKRRSLQELVGNEGLNSWGPWAPRLAWAAVLATFMYLSGFGPLGLWIFGASSYIFGIQRAREAQRAGK